MDNVPERTMEKTPTWAVAVVCFVLIVISILIEHIIHVVEHWLKHRNKRALGEALEKIKAELMLLGFISLLLTVLQDPVSGMCISESIGDTWHPCKPGKGNKEKEGRKLLQFLESGFGERRRLATKGYDSCAKYVSSIETVSLFNSFFFFLFYFSKLYFSLAPLKRLEIWNIKKLDSRR